MNRRNRRSRGNHRSSEAHFDRLEARRLMTTIYVDASAGGATHNGNSWATAFTDLQQALSAAVLGDRINVAKGTYKPTSGTDRTVSFQLKNGVEMYGGYAGGSSATPDARDVGLNPTVLSGEIGNAGTTADNSWHVVNASGVTASTIFDGFRVTAGNAPGNPPGGPPGDTPGNSAGGGMLIVRGAPTVRNSTFVGNNYSGVFNYGLGQFSNYGASPTFTDCVFDSNTVPGNQVGGGLYNHFSNPTVTRCTFINNVANSGAGVENWSSLPVFLNCLFQGNKAAFGGAVESGFSTVKFTNCAFVGNNTISTGAVTSDVNFTTTTYANCTFAMNVGTSTLINWAGNGVAGSMTNSIVWGNSVASVLPGGMTVTYSDVQGGVAGTGNVNVDPQFQQLPSPGPDGTWTTADDNAGNLRLKTTSPLIDAGNNAGVPAGVTTDLGGGTRVVDYPNVNNGAGAVVDMGAYEVQLNILHVLSNQTYAFPAAAVYTYDGLVIDPGGRLELGTSALVLPSSALASVAAWVAEGSQQGTWLGTGITSSSAAGSTSKSIGVGFLDDGATLTVRRTYYGDANLSGAVSADDVALMLQRQAAGRSDWSAGNFNYDARAGSPDDWALFSKGVAFNTRALLPPTNPGVTSAAVPFATAPIGSILDDLLGADSILAG